MALPLRPPSQLPEQPEPTVAEFMTCDPLTIGGDIKLQDALTYMVRHRIRHLPVLDGRSFCGILSGPSLLGDLLHRSSFELRNLASLPVRDFLQCDPPLDPTTKIRDVYARLERTHCLPVVQNGELRGLFSHHNALSSLHRSLCPDQIRRGGATPTTQRMDSLVSLVRSLSATNDTDPQEILETTIKFLTNLMPVSEAFLLIKDDNLEHLNIFGQYPNSLQTGPVTNESIPPNSTPGKAIPIVDTLSGYVYTHRRSLKIDNLQTEKRFPRSLQLHQAALEVKDLKSVIATPLMDRHRAFGVFHLWSDQRYAYVDSDLETLELISGYISFLILRAWQIRKEKALVAQLQKANQIKDEFLAVVTHDLKNSIQGILALTQLLEKKTKDSGHGGLTSAIQDSAKHMSNLTTDLHDLAKLGMQAIRLKKQDCDIVAIINLVFEEFREFARQESVELQAVNLPNRLILWADPLRMRQVVSNLVSNSIKYNRKDGWVRVSACENGSEVELCVQDSGIGIAKEELSRVFELFHQAANNRRLDGSGLGLSLSQQLAELHGGQLTVQSELGQGSTFRLHLPLKES